MLSTLRRLSIREQRYCWGLASPGSQKLLNTLEIIADLAA